MTVEIATAETAQLMSAVFSRTSISALSMFCIAAGALTATLITCIAPNGTFGIVSSATSRSGVP